MELTVVDRYGLDLTIIKKGKQIIFFESQKDNYKDMLHFYFDKDILESIRVFLNKLATNTWPNLNIREANSLESDYDEYYDKESDNNGYMSINCNGFTIERSNLESNILYHFNKKRMESFLYDLNKKVFKED